MIVKEIISDTDSVYNYMQDEIVLGYLEIRLVDGVVDIMNLFVSEDARRQGDRLHDVPHYPWTHSPR